VGSVDGTPVAVDGIAELTPVPPPPTKPGVGAAPGVVLGPRR